MSFRNSDRGSPAEEKKGSATNLLSDAAEQKSPPVNGDSALDPHDVFNASLQFENENLKQLPRTSLDFRGSMGSRSSLYPSLESLEQTDSTRNLEQQWEAASRVSPAAAATPHVASLQGSTVREFSADDLIAEKMAAYSGMRAPSPLRNSSRAFNENNDDDDLIAMKLAAYEGGKPTRVTATSVPGTSTLQPAEATFVEYNVHPADISQNAVQAQFVAPVNAPLDQQNAASGSTLDDPNLTAYIAAEVAVIESGPAEKATAEAWSNAPAAEATVMDQPYDHQNGTGLLDSKPPARDPRYEQPFDATGHVQAMVVDYDVHPPSEPAFDAVQAQLLGQDYNASAEIASGDCNEQVQAALGAYEAEAIETVDDNVTEVAVIESGPMEKATAEAWSASTSGHAQVLVDDIAPANQESAFATKAVVGEESNSDMHEYHESFATDAGDAEIIDITEEVHPAEFVGEATVEAELVGSAFNTAIAVPSDVRESSLLNGESETVEQAELVLPESALHVETDRQQQHQEVHATLVPSSEQPDFDVSGGIATAVLETSRSTSDPLPATPVTVLESPSVPDLPPRVSFSDPVKPEPYSGRIQSAPSAAGEVSEAQTIERPEWERVASFGGGDSAPDPIPPPVTSLDGTPPIPIPQNSNAVEESSTSGRNRNTSSSDASVPGLQMLSSGIARGANNVMETLFGNVTPGSRRSQGLAEVDLDRMSGSVLPRTLLPSSVIFSEATKSWVATVNTNQKALEANNVEESSKSLRAFSVPTQKQATALARAWAPPQMHPFSSNPTCFICESQFAVFRRASHCRNCGVCVCGPCSLQWPAKMLPVTYNIKKESTVCICKACDWLCSEFRLALLQGSHDKAVALHSTGNINLTTPFANVKGELFYPVHCAVLGGSLALLKWLVDEHCCPLRSIRISNGKVRGASSGSYTPILTSKGRSLLGIALGNRNIGIVRYLVVEKRMQLAAEKSLSVESLTANLDLVLRILPEAAISEQAIDSSGVMTRSVSGHSDSNLHYEGNDEISAIKVPVGSYDDFGGSADSDNDICIICCDDTINCVFTPCGHQICCLTCGNNISRCPVCSVECAPMRVFKP